MTSDIRLIAVDMDGTLLDPEHRVPPTLGPLLDQLAERGIVFCPASGRQLATLRSQLGGGPGTAAFIAENGAHTWLGDGVLALDPLDGALVPDLVRAVRHLAGAVPDAGAVVCGVRSAYVERTDEPFRSEADRYYAVLEEVPDLLAVHDEVLKVAVFTGGDVQVAVAPRLRAVGGAGQVVVSGRHWADVMSPTASKGRALSCVQESLGVTPEQTMAFGDHLNDLELLDGARWSFAVANAHPDVRARARFGAPSNAEDGVVRTIRDVLGLRS